MTVPDENKDAKTVGQRRAEIQPRGTYITIPKDFMAARNIPPAAKLVLGAQINYLGPKSYCFPSIRRLADDTGLTPRTVQRAIDFLEREGHISRRKGGRHRSNSYTIHIQKSRLRLPDTYEECGQNVRSADGEAECGHSDAECGNPVASIGQNVLSTSDKMSTELQYGTTERTITPASSPSSPSARSSLPSHSDEIGTATTTPETNGVEQPTKQQTHNKPHRPFPPTILSPEKWHMAGS